MVDLTPSYGHDDIEILLVDNGSVDNTFNALLNLNLPSNIVPIRVEKNIGYGNGILFGFHLNAVSLLNDVSIYARSY